ncbi:MAG: DUF1146 domain-containing protein [Bacilli bacterium]|jgi:uncharacterized integral membrane protein (TIGR02327 family)|nr:DUF1146 domain-containing protein [Bacilli bacterium]
MNYKLFIYAFNILLCIFATSAINFEKIIRKNKGLETRILAMIVSLVLAYLLTNFIFDFIEWSKMI